MTSRCFISFFKPIAGGCLLLAALAVKVNAAVLEGVVTDQSGAPLANAVVTVTPADGRTPAPDPAPAVALLDQRNREFVPHVLVIHSGTDVKFPNNDNIRHHVYSFSPAKRFEIKLYKGVPPDPVKFGAPGVAVLGCNIHDWMISYVYVTDAPYFTKTDETGRWLLNVPENSYRIGFWHPYQADSAAVEAEPVTAGREKAVINRTLTIKPTTRTGKPLVSQQAEGYKGEP
ncbi:MAG: hypothetical protein ABSB19_02270 [Methylomonas sp.]|jgi:plastocyanin